MKKLLISKAVSLLAMTVFIPVASAFCFGPQEAGRWANTSGGSAEVTRLEIFYTNSCANRDVEWKPYDGPVWYVEAFGKCDVEECSWGRIGAEQADHRRFSAVPPAGSPKVSPVYAAFDRGAVKIYFFIHMTLGEKDMLRVRAYTDYPEGGAPDRSEDLVFRRLGPFKANTKPRTIIHE